MCVFAAWKVPVCDSKAAIQLDMDISTSAWQKHYNDFPTPQMLYLHTNPPDAHAVTYTPLKAVQQCSKILKAFTKSSSTALTNEEITLKHDDREDITMKGIATMGRYQQELSASGQLAQGGKVTPKVPVVLFCLLTINPSFGFKDRQEQVQSI